MDSSNIVRIILGIATILYSLLGIWYFTGVPDYYGLFIAVGLLVIGVLMTFSGIVQKTSKAHSDDETRVDFDEWVIIAWAGAAALGLYYLIAPYYLSILYPAIFFLYYAVINTLTYLIEKWVIIRKKKSKQTNYDKRFKEIQKEERNRQKELEKKRRYEEKKKRKADKRRLEEEKKRKELQEKGLRDLTGSGQQPQPGSERYKSP